MKKIWWLWPFGGVVSYVLTAAVLLKKETLKFPAPLQLDFSHVMLYWQLASLGLCWVTVVTMGIGFIFMKDDVELIERPKVFGRMTFFTIAILLLLSPGGFPLYLPLAVGLLLRGKRAFKLMLRD